MRAPGLTHADERYLTSAERMKLHQRDEYDTALLEFFGTLNLRVDLSLRQRYETDLRTVRPASPRVKYQQTEYVERTLPGESSPRLVLRRQIAETPDTQTIAVPPLRCRLNDAPQYATHYYLKGNETTKIAVRVMNRLNAALFGRGAARKTDPLHVTALVCRHDRRTRQHLHALFAVPVDISRAEFLNALSGALKREPFIYRHVAVADVESVAKSVFYNMNALKSLDGAPIVYMYPDLRANRSKHNAQNENDPTGYDNLIPRDAAGARQAAGDCRAGAAYGEQLPSDGAA